MESNTTGLPDMMTDLIPLSGELVQPDNANPAVVYLARFPSENSRQAMRRALSRALAVVNIDVDPLRFPWYQLRYEHVQAFRSKLIESYKPATVNQTLSALRGILKECWRLGLLDAEAYRRAVDVEDVRYKILPQGRVVGFGGQRQLFEACRNDGRAPAARDAAMIAVLFGTGVRRAEVVGFDLGDLDEDGSLKVRGKGRKERLVYLTNGSLNAVDDWLDLRGREPGALFVQIKKGGKLTPNRLTPQAVWYIIKRRAKQAGLDLSPHDTRRTFASLLLDLGVDTFIVQELMGHSDPKTTARYNLRGERAKRKAAQALEVPYFSVNLKK